MEGYYLRNRETGKLELHFDKSYYISLPDEAKKNIKSSYLWSSKAGTWVSRSKFPNLYSAQHVAESLGLKNRGIEGESLSFEEQQKKKAERAENRADRYDERAASAFSNGKNLQAPIDHMHGDIAFFTQPNINTSSGRSFTNRRDRMFKTWEKGFEEFKKSEYYAERAKIARETAAESSKPKDKAFCQRRIDEAEKIIKKQCRNIERYEKILSNMGNGIEIKKYNGEKITAEQTNEWISTTEEIIENNISKSLYYRQCLEDFGGVEFSKDNIKVGYIVQLTKWKSPAEILSTGPKCIKYRDLQTQMVLKASYAEIEKIIKEVCLEEKPIEHPFRVDDVYTVDRWDPSMGKYISVEYTITKVSSLKVTLKHNDERSITRSPRKCYNQGEWCLAIADGLNGSVYKRAN